MTDNALAAIATDHGVHISAQTMHGPADDQRIDDWELKASRRALANLRELLYGAPMLELLDEQINDADRRMTRYLADSHGEFTATQVVLDVDGLSTSELFPVLRAIMAGAAGTDEQRRQAALDMAFPCHPEHYALPPYVGVVETMGGIPTRSRVKVIDDAPEFVTRFADESYPLRVTGAGELDDGEIFTYVLQQFKNTDTGMEANLRIWYPAACPPAYIEEHAQHYTVEFRNGCRLAAAHNRTLTAENE